MADEIVMGSAVKGVTHIAAFDTLAKTRFDAFSLEKILVSMFDTVDARLLDILAAQYDMLGYNGWILAETEQEKRELLKAAVGLKKITGTPASIREVVKRLGFLDVEIKEGWDHSSPDPVPVAPWAYFRVVYDLPGDKAITEEIANNLVGLINNYKPARSKLQDFKFSTPKTDKMGLVGEVNLKIIDVATNTVLEETTQRNTLMFSGMFWMLTTFGAKGVGGLPGSDEFNDLPRFNLDKISFGTNGTVGDEVSPDFITSPFTKDLGFVPGPATIGWSRFYIDESTGLKTLTHYFSLSSSEANGTVIRELGLVMTDHNSVEADVLLARITRAPISKTASIKIEGTWKIFFAYNNYPASADM